MNYNIHYDNIKIYYMIILRYLCLKISKTLTMEKNSLSVRIVKNITFYSLKYTLQYQIRIFKIIMRLKINNYLLISTQNINLSLSYLDFGLIFLKTIQFFYPRIDLGLSVSD